MKIYMKRVCGVIILIFIIINLTSCVNKNESISFGIGYVETLCDKEKSLITLLDEDLNYIDEIEVNRGGMNQKIYCVEDDLYAYAAGLTGEYKWTDIEKVDLKKDKQLKNIQYINIGDNNVYEYKVDKDTIYSVSIKGENESDLKSSIKKTDIGIKKEKNKEIVLDEMIHKLYIGEEYIVVAGTYYDNNEGLHSCIYRLDKDTLEIKGYKDITNCGMEVGDIAFVNGVYYMSFISQYSKSQGEIISDRLIWFKEEEFEKEEKNIQYKKLECGNISDIYVENDYLYMICKNQLTQENTAFIKYNTVNGDIKKEEFDKKYDQVFYNSKKLYLYDKKENMLYKVCAENFQIEKETKIANKLGEEAIIQDIFR